MGYAFKDPALLHAALTHPSIAQGADAGKIHNQRLEFLGDAVLQLIVTVELYVRFPHLDEGALTKARAHLVNRQMLAAYGRRLHLGTLLVMSRGECQSGGRHRASALADAFEAVIGAIYLDAGLDAARDCVLRIFQDELGHITDAPNVENPKGELQELLQAESAESPVYQLLGVTGPDHDRLFECAVLHRGLELGRGTGKSKKTAESQAACAALQAVRGTQSPGPILS